MDMPAQQWVFPARLVRVIDGDSQVLEISLGFHLYRIDHIRLLGVDAPEVRGVSKVAGDLATAYVRAWYAQAQGEWPLVVRTYKSDSFGRYLALCWRIIDGACLNRDLLAAGHAVVYQ